MKKYIGREEISATPMTYGEAYKDGIIPPNAYVEGLSDKAGYKITDGNDSFGWLNKEDFEKLYQIAETPMDRVIIEYTELREKSEKLHNYLGNSENNSGTIATWAMLHAQEAAMYDYMQALALRHTVMESGDGAYCGFNFGVAVALLKKGFVLRRAGWNGKGLIVFKQVPTDIKAEIIPGMQSVPVEAKRLILDSARHIDYTSQCLIYNRQTGRADSWVASISDIFAEDWEVVTD